MRQESGAASETECSAEERVKKSLAADFDRSERFQEQDQRPKLDSWKEGVKTGSEI
jgi:hypothetical protein